MKKKLCGYPGCTALKKQRRFDTLKLEEYEVIRDYGYVRLWKQFGKLYEPIYDKKSGKQYYIERIVINTTDLDNVTAMVLYRNRKQQLYVCGVDEFIEKFCKKTKEV